MALFRFLSRIAFICNLFFLPLLLLHFKDFIPNQIIESSVIIIGYFLAILLNPLVNVCNGVLLLLKRNLFAFVPKWLVAVNFIFLLLQVLYIFLLNDVFKH